MEGGSSPTFKQRAYIASRMSSGMSAGLVKISSAGSLALISRREVPGPRRPRRSQSCTAFLARVISGAQGTSRRNSCKREKENRTQEQGMKVGLCYLDPHLSGTTSTAGYAAPGLTRARARWLAVPGFLLGVSLRWLPGMSGVLLSLALVLPPAGGRTWLLIRGGEDTGESDKGGGAHPQP